MKFIMILSSILVLVGITARLFPRAVVAVVAQAIPMTDDEINACATMVALKDYRREYDRKTKQWIPDVRSEEDAIQSLLVDEGDRPDMLRRKASYERQFSIPTVYTRYVDEGILLCAQMKMRGEKINFPDLKIRDGYHITRWNGSAALVKNGEAEPTFGMTVNGQTIWSDGRVH